MHVSTTALMQTSSKIPGAATLDLVATKDGSPDERLCSLHGWTIPMRAVSNGTKSLVCFDCFWDALTKGDTEAYLFKEARLAPGMSTEASERCAYVDEAMDECESAGTERCVSCGRYVCQTHFSGAYRACDNCIEGRQQRVNEAVLDGGSEYDECFT